MFIVRIRQPATYAMCVILFFGHFWVTLPGAPHLLNCAETNGGIVKQRKSSSQILNLAELNVYNVVVDLTAYLSDS
jgi:hypothetical protein